MCTTLNLVRYFLNAGDDAHVTTVDLNEDGFFGIACLQVKGVRVQYWSRVPSDTTGGRSIPKSISEMAGYIPGLRPCCMTTYRQKSKSTTVGIPIDTKGPSQRTDGLGLTGEK